MLTDASRISVNLVGLQASLTPQISHVSVHHTIQKSMYKYNVMLFAITRIAWPAAAKRNPALAYR